MNTVHTTFAVAEDTYRRDRARHDLQLAGGGHHLHRLGSWRDRRRGARRSDQGQVLGA